ncbi:MAG: hypothetical protein ACK4UN_04005 [Limisphaerales bacterium]
MKRTLHLQSLALGALLGAIIVFTVAAGSTQKTAWEYRSHYLHGSHANMETINNLGNQGWELVGFFNSPDGKYPGLMFKRTR